MTSQEKKKHVIILGKKKEKKLVLLRKKVIYIEMLFCVSKLYDLYKAKLLCYIQIS